MGCPVLGDAQRGRVRLIGTPDVDATRREVVAEAERGTVRSTVVSVQWELAPPPDERQSHLLEALAEAARSLWPQWYATVDERFDRQRWPRAEVECRLAGARVAAAGVSASWFRKAWQYCQNDRSPVLRRFAAAEQLRQLALALDPTGCTLLLAVRHAAAPSERVYALARSAEWAALQTEARVLLIVPAEWRGRVELDVVSYAAAEHVPVMDDPPLDSEPSPAIRDDRPLVLVEPHAGTPHPGSAAEKRLADVLSRDRELGGLFRHNQVVPGYLDTRYRVDLVWPDGRVAVEIDGSEHRGAAHYRADRERDYRLLLAGYAVLRVTNEDVLEDTALVVEKLRNVVRFRREEREA